MKDKIKIVGVIFEHGDPKDKDWSLWFPDDLSDEDSKKVTEILDVYRHDGCSVRDDNVYNYIHVLDWWGD